MDIAVHEPYQIDKKYLESFTVKPGFKYIFSINPSQLKADENLGALHVKERNCRLTEDEMDFRIYVGYTQQNCWFHHRVARIWKDNACLPWNAPFSASKENFSICALSAHTYQKRMKSWKTDEKTCPKACESISYALNTHMEKMDLVAECIKIRLNNKFPHPLLSILRSGWTAMDAATHYNKDLMECVMRMQGTAIVHLRPGTGYGIFVRQFKRATFASQLGTLG
jgi:hypothetical protein